MVNRLNLTVIVLAKNEELHMERCMVRIAPYVEKVFVVDCFSTDRTCEIAQRNGAEVIKHAWPGLYALQFNWALESLAIRTPWVLRLDADEYLSEALLEELRQKLPVLTANEEITGIVLPLRRIFLGRHMRGCDGIELLRIFRTGYGRSENRMMDEHIVLSGGDVVTCKNWFADDNLNDLAWWTKKHIGYARREAMDLLNLEYGDHKDSSLISGQAKKKRRLKEKYARQPLFFRSFAYFCYRYFLKMGFRDGKEGFLWDFQQAWWYRTLVDAEIIEIRKQCGNNPQTIRAMLESEEFRK